MNKTTYTTTRFDVNDDFYVEVSPNGDWIEFVLCMKGYGMKSHMFGMHKKDCSEEIWEQLIENDIEEHIDNFYSHIYDVYESGFLEEHGFYDRNTNE
jgi:hypothetical protein